MAEFSTSIDIEAPPDAVFTHLCTPAGMVAWMGQHAELEPVPGGVFAVDVNGTLFRGEYLEVDPPHRVVMSSGIAGSQDLPPGSSRVEVHADTECEWHDASSASHRAPRHAGWYACGRLDDLPRAAAAGGRRGRSGGRHLGREAKDRDRGAMIRPDATPRGFG